MRPRAVGRQAESRSLDQEPSFGLRVSEMLALRRKDFDWMGGDVLSSTVRREVKFHFLLEYSMSPLLGCNGVGVSTGSAHAVAGLSLGRSRPSFGIWRPVPVVQVHASKQRVRPAIEEFKSNV
jgi:hypothetical protein